VELVVLFLEDVLIVFNFLELGFGGFDERGLVVDNFLQAVDELSNFLSRYPSVIVF
jgi:hypothetical protein